MTISTSVWSAQHPNDGRNIQHLPACPLNVGGTQKGHALAKKGELNVKCILAIEGSTKLLKVTNFI